MTVAVFKFGYMLENPAYVKIPNFGENSSMGIISREGSKILLENPQRLYARSLPEGGLKIQSELHSDMQRRTEMSRPSKIIYGFGYLKANHCLAGLESNKIVGLYLMWAQGYLKGSSLQYERT